jgi:hypothetical protein
MVDRGEPDPRRIALLRLAVQQARDGVSVARRLDGIERHQLATAQRHLLGVLEVYVEALEAAGLAAHWQLRTEMDLLRGVIDASPRPRWAARRGPRPRLVEEPDQDADECCQRDATEEHQVPVHAFRPPGVEVVPSPESAD